MTEPTVKQRVIIAGFAVATVGGVFVLLVALEWAGVDYQKWFKFMGWTVLLFGCVAYLYGASLKRLRCLSAFLGMLAIHVSVLILYLRSTDRFPSMFFLFFSPFEAMAVAFVLISLGARSHRTHRIERPPHHKWPPNPT